MMKKTYKIFMEVLAAAAVFSCTSKISPVFEDSSANRIEAMEEELDDVLRSSPNGWIMEYYPSSGQYYGGYNVLMSFTDGGNVKVASEASGVGKTAGSTYSIYQSSGCILSFDTYNEVMHFFSDPETSNGGGAGYGYEGDFEFNVLSLSEDEIIVKGRKSGSVMKMTPMPISMTWDEYLKGIKKEESAISDYDRLRYQTEDARYDIRISGRSFNVYSEVDGEQVVTSYPFIVNLMGISFYRPVVLGDEKIDGLIFSPDMGDGGAFIPVNDGAEGYFVPTYPSITDYLTSKNWFFAYSGFSDYGKRLWDKAAAALKTAGDDIVYCYLGNVSNIYGDFYAFNFICTKSSAKGYLAFDVNVKGEDRVSLRFSREGSAIGKEYYTDYSFNAIITPLGNEKERTFSLTVDDVKDPQWIKFTDEEEPENWFTVYRSSVYYPLAN